jgi:hypothetical protein
MSTPNLSMRERVQSLGNCGDAASLQSAVSAICGEFGRITRIEVMTLAAEKRRALCLLRLESEAQESRLMTSLGASRFGEDVLVIVDLPAATH